MNRLASPLAPMSVAPAGSVLALHRERGWVRVAPGPTIDGARCWAVSDGRGTAFFGEADFEGWEHDEP